MSNKKRVYKVNCDATDSVAAAVTETESATSFQHQGNSISTNGEKKQRTDAVLNKDKEEEEEEGGGGEEVNKLWDVVHVIPKGKEKVECCNNGCKDQGILTWSSNIDPEDKRDLCKNCQLKEMGELPDEVDLIKYSITTNNDQEIWYLEILAVFIANLEGGYKHMVEKYCCQVTSNVYFFNKHSKNFLSVLQVGRILHLVDDEKKKKKKKKDTAKAVAEAEAKEILRAEKSV